MTENRTRAADASAGAACGLAAVLLASLLLLPGFASAATRDPAPRLAGLRGLSNVGMVETGLLRGGTPAAPGFETLRQLGVRTVINLRHYHGDAEERACREAGLEYVRVKLESSDAPSDTDVRRFLGLVADPARRPVYVHCWRGKDRTGVMMAVYRMAVQDWPLEDALREMDAYGFFRGWRDLRRYVIECSARREEFRPASWSGAGVCGARTGGDR